MTMRVEAARALLRSVPPGSISFQKMAAITGMLNCYASDRQFVPPKDYCLCPHKGVQMSIQIRCHDYGHDWPLKAGLRQETPLLIMRKPRAEFMESGSNSDRRLLEYVRKLAAQHVVDREKCDDNVYAELEQLREELLTNLKWTEQVMEMLGRPVPKPVGAVTPPPVLDSIRGFLRSAGCPQPVELVIRAVGEQRRRDFPGLTRPFADVSKSLQYHDRTDGEVVCVRWGEDGRLERVSLKKIKLKSGSRRGRQQGWIWFRDKIETYTPIANYS